MIDLRDRVAIVTGAGRGIGRAYALRFAAYGARVVVNDAGVTTEGGATDEDPARDVVHEITRTGGEALAHRGDVADAAVGDAVVQRALDTWGRLDIVVNNAGFGRPRMVFNLGDDEWDDVVRVHLRGTFVISRPACRHWRAQAKQHGSTYGRLINTATGLLIYGGAGQSNYVAAKAGVQAFTEAVATEMAPYGVTANTIMPGANTRLAQIGWRMARQEERRPPTMVSRSIHATPCTSPSSARISRRPTRVGSRARRFRCGAASSNACHRGKSRGRCNATMPASPRATTPMRFRGSSVRVPDGRTRRRPSGARSGRAVRSSARRYGVRGMLMAHHTNPTADLLVDALASYRVTRLLVSDGIVDRQRHAVVDRLRRRGHRKLVELSECPWCIGFWVACGVVAARRVIPRTWAPVAEAFAFSAVSGLLASEVRSLDDAHDETQQLESADARERAAGCTRVLATRASSTSRSPCRRRPRPRRGPS